MFYLLQNSYKHRGVRYDNELTAKLDFLVEGRYLSSEDLEFVDKVVADIKGFLKNSSEDRVLLFPPVNSYHRFLIHKVAEDFAEVRSFSVGEGSDRQTVVCHQDSLRRGPKGIELMSSSCENWPAGRGRGRLSRNKGSPSPHGGSTPPGAGGDGVSFPVSEHAAACSDTAHMDSISQEKQSATGDNQKTRKSEAVASTDSRKSLTSRAKTKKKKPEIQVYVPRAKRLQQQQQELEDSAGKDNSELVNTYSSQPDVSHTEQNTKEHFLGHADNHTDKPVSTRRKTRPEMQRYVPRGKREMMTSMTDNCAMSSSNEKAYDFSSEKTEKSSSRTRPAKKLKMAENSSEILRTDKNRKDLETDLTTGFVSSEDCILEDVNTSHDQNNSMEVESWEDLEEATTTSENLNISSKSCDKQFSDSDNNTFNIPNSINEVSASKQNVSSDPVSTETESSQELLDSNNMPTVSIELEHDTHDTRVCADSTSDLICASPSWPETVPGETSISMLQLVNSKDVSCEDVQKGTVSLDVDSIPSYNKQELSSEDHSFETEHFKNSNHVESTPRQSVEHSSVSCNFSEMVVSPNPDICPIEVSKEIECLDMDLNPVDSKQHSYISIEDESLGDLCSGCIPDLKNDCKPSCVTNTEITSTMSHRLSALTMPSEDLESERQVPHSLSLPDVVASTMDPKVQNRSGGGILTSIALRQLETATDHRSLPSDELINSELESEPAVEGGSESEDEDGWEAMFDDNGDCLDPSIMEELTSHVGNVKIDKPKINYLKFETKDPELDMEVYNHVIEISDFPSEFTTRDLIGVFKDFIARGFDIKWVDDTHALGVFANTIAARDALAMVSPFLKVRPLSEASKQSKMKAKKSTEFLQPYKPRPQTSAVTARRMVSGALGIQASIPREKRELERKQLKEAKEKRKQARQQKQDIWDGEFGKCAMDDT